MLGFGCEAELPLAVGSTLPIIPPGNGPTVLMGLRQFLLTILPTGVQIVQGQDNRVSEPSSDAFVVMTPLRRMRLATNIDHDVDCRFEGSVSGTTLTVTKVDFGVIEPNAPLSGLGVLPGTTITNTGTGGGGAGVYTISQSQVVSQRVLAAGQSLLMQETEVVVQLDIHDANNPTPGSMTAQELVGIITTAFRDEYATDWFDENYPGVSPLYADHGSQMPFLNAEQQYEDRWVIEAHLQINPTFALPMQFADDVVVIPVPVNIFPSG